MIQNGTPGEISPARREAIAALVAGATITAAAAAVGVGRTTLHRRLREDEVVAELNGAKHEAADAIRGELRRLAPAAVQAPRGILTAPAAPATARLRATEMALRAIGGTAAGSIGPTGPASVRQRREWDRDADRLERLG